MDCSEGMRNLPSGEKYCVVTDPPFNVGYHYNSYKDKMKEDEYFAWLNSLTESLPAVMIHYPESLHRFSIERKEAPIKVVSWVYNANTAKQHRDIAFYGIKPDLNKVRQPYKDMKDKRNIANMAKGLGGGRMYDWVFENQVKNKSKIPYKGITHPCQMPLSIMDKIIRILPEDITVIDPFVGSGTTITACIRNKRKYIGFEIDEKYYELAQFNIQTEKQKLF